MPWVLILVVVVAIVAVGAWILGRKRDETPTQTARATTSERSARSASNDDADLLAPPSSRAGQVRPPKPKPSTPPPKRESENGDDEDQDITLVGVMPDEIRALQKGYRDIRPEEAVPSRHVPEDAEIEIGPEETVDQVLIDELLSDEPTGPHSFFDVRAVAATDIGRKRKHNEDSHVELPEKAVFVVADGMGGHAAGDVASGMAVTVIAQAFDRGEFGGPPNILWPKRADELARSIETANKAVFERASGEDGLRGMGTTVTALRFAPQKRRAYVAHVGDSRCYRIRRGHILRLTNDHTLGNLMGAKGKLAAQLSQAVGVREDVKVDLTIDRPEPDDLYLLCSDGLTKMVPDDVLKEIILETPDIDECARKLIDEANSMGGYDNITLILARISPTAYDQQDAFDVDVASQGSAEETAGAPSAAEGQQTPADHQAKVTEGQA